MNDTVQRLIAEIARLPEDDRVAILDGVWATLGDDAKDELASADPTIDPECRAELERRIAEADAHPERLIDAETAFKLIRAELAAREESRRTTAAK